MFSPNAVALRVLKIVLLIGVAAISGYAQCPSALPDTRVIPKIPVRKPVTEEPLLPEAGFLTNTHYTSQFFGFSFDLPLTVHGHEIMMPVMPEKQHLLLALQYEQAQRKGYIMVTAYDPVAGFDANTPEENERELRTWSQAGTQAGGLPQIPVPDFMLRSNHFYHQIRHHGSNYAAQYWAGINNYTVKIVVSTNDAEFMRKAKDAMSEAQFYCPQDDGTLITSDGKPVKIPGEPYAGPTVPTFRVNAALRDQPAKNIGRGAVVDGMYRNPEIGLQYELPKGWKAVAEDPAPPPAVNAMREYQFLHACSQTLMQIAPQREKGSSNRDSAIVLRAVDPNCLSLRTATSLTDKRALDEVAASFEELGEFGQLGSDELMSISGHLFMVFHGTIPAPAGGEGLAERFSQTIFATRYNKLLLVWSFMAATSSALEQMPASNVVFEGSPPIQLSTAKRDKAAAANP